MKNFLPRFFFTAIVLCFIATAADAQIKKIPVKTLKLAGETSVFIVGQSAKLAGKAALKSTPVVLHAAEKTSIFILKQTKELMVKTVLPASRKLIVKYLKYRLMA